jgi:signal transduction histidine kinase
LLSWREKLIAAQETERARIARELHDDLGQQVALLATQLDTMKPPAIASASASSRAPGTVCTRSPRA